MNKLDKESVIGISALLVHAANIATKVKVFTFELLPLVEFLKLL